MLAMADRRGRVWASIPGLANRAQVTVKDVEEALEKFLAPDPYSRTSAHEGRRIEIIDGGWKLLNHGKYRTLRDDEERKSYKRDWIRDKREKENVDNVDKSRPPYTQAEAEALSDSSKSNPLSCKHDDIVIVKTVFKTWQGVLNHPRSKLDDKRIAKIKQALKNYTADDLTKAFRGCAVSPYHMGDNDRSTKYDDITLILRDAEHVERFMGYDDDPPSKQTKPWRPENETRPRKPLS